MRIEMSNRASALSATSAEQIDTLPLRSTREQVAVWLGIHTRTLDRWHALGEGPPRIKIGKQIFYRGPSVQAWFEALEKAA
jgi:hypothetical protein